MATSTMAAQSPIPCQLCNKDVVIKWKCTDCELLLCDNCKTNIHSRFKSSEKHRVVSTEDIGNDIADQLKGLHISEVVSSIFNTYQTKLPCIEKTSCYNDDIVFLLSYHDTELTQHCHVAKTKILKDSLKVLKQFDIDCQDFAVNPEHDLIFSPKPGSKLKGISTKTGDCRTILKASPMIILAIHLNKHGELVLGLREQGPKYPVTDFCTRQVTILNTNYKRKATFEFDHSGQKLFSYAKHIESDTENNIYVQDRINDQNYGQIVCLDMKGRTKFVYKGHSILNTPDNPFMPSGIAISPKNALLIADMNNHAIHAITKQGELCGLHCTDNLGIFFPYSLSFDSEGFLLIGCSTSKDDTTPEAYIHVVKTLF